MRKATLLFLLVLICAGAQAQDTTQTARRVAVLVSNASSTGTTRYRLAKLTSAPSKAVIAATTDTDGIIGIVTAGAGTAGTATIQTSGQTLCDFDGATTAGDYVQISTGTAGKCHDTGASTYPTSGQIVGRVLSTNVGAGTYYVLLTPGVKGSAGGTVTSVTGTSPIASSGGATPAISLNDTAVTPGAYTYAGFTVDAKGRLTAAASGATPEVVSNKDATGGYAGLTLFKINFKNAADTFTSFFTNANSAARTYTFQNRDGTITDNTDLALKAALASPTFTGTVGLPLATTTGSMAVGGAVFGGSQLIVRGTHVASGSSVGVYDFVTKQAAANNNTLFGFRTDMITTPGAFTGLTVRGVEVTAFSTAAFTSPGDPAGVNIGVVTGTGATNAYGVKIAAPTGASNNYGIYNAGNTTSVSYGTVTNCADSAGAAACGSAPAGAVVIDAAATEVVISTTAITANSQIFVQYDTSLGTRLGVTCNVTVAVPYVSARTAGTSFTVTVPVSPITNPLCLNYDIKN